MPALFFATSYMTLGKVLVHKKNQNGDKIHLTDL